MTEPVGPEPLVAVIIPALNEAGKIGRVLDKLPRDGRFEAIVVDDGSTDGTGDEARAHGAATNGFRVFRSELLADTAERNLGHHPALT